MILTIIALEVFVLQAVDPLTLLQIVLAAAAVTSLGGVGFQSGRLTSLRGQLTDAREEITVLKAKDVEKTALIKQQRADIGALQRTVTGEAYLVAIDKMIKEHNTKAQEHWHREEEMHGDLTQKLANLPGLVDQLRLILERINRPETRT